MDEFSEYEVGEEEISDEEWEALVSKMGKKELSAENGHSDKRTKQDPVPVNLSDYLNKLQFSSIKKLENFGWELFFIRRSDPDKVVTVMHSPSFGETAVIEKDGTVNRTHNVFIRKDESESESEGPKSSANRRDFDKSGVSANSVDETVIKIDIVKETEDGRFEIYGQVFETRERAEGFFAAYQKVLAKKLS